MDPKAPKPSPDEYRKWLRKNLGLPYPRELEIVMNWRRDNYKIRRRVQTFGKRFLNRKSALTTYTRHFR